MKLPLKTGTPLLLLTVLVSLAATAADKIPTAKQTKLALYVTAQEAYQKWKADTNQVKILDVRTPEEYAFVGHPAMAWNIPLIFVAYQWDADKKFLATKPNPDFLARAKAVFGPDHTILVMCRSGDRSAKACNLLADAGYKQVYTIVDGMEGDAVKDPNRPDVGKRTINGWKNSGLPWTYNLDTNNMYLAPEK